MIICDICKNQTQYANNEFYLEWEPWNLKTHVKLIIPGIHICSYCFKKFLNYVYENDKIFEIR